MMDIFITLIIGAFIGSLAALGEVWMIGHYQKNKAMLYASAMHWIGVGALLPFVMFDLPVWATGILVSLVLSIPNVILAVYTSRNAIIHTTVFVFIFGVILAYTVTWTASLI